MRFDVALYQTSRSNGGSCCGIPLCKRQKSAVLSYWFLPLHQVFTCTCSSTSCAVALMLCYVYKPPPKLTSLCIRVIGFTLCVFGLRKLFHLMASTCHSILSNTLFFVSISTHCSILCSCTVRLGQACLPCHFPGS